MDLLSQPFNGQLGNCLIEHLRSGQYKRLTMVVAFAKTSGVLRLRQAFESFRAAGGSIEAFVGVDMGGTSYEALDNLLMQTDSLHVVHLESSQTFHPKIYDFVGEDGGVVIVGSNNLTGGGLWSNVESSLCIPFDNMSSEGRRLQQEVEEYIAGLWSLGDAVRPIEGREDVEQLCTGGYVEHEIVGRVRRAKERSGDSKEKKGIIPFSKGLPARMPELPSGTKSMVSMTTAATDTQKLNEATVHAFNMFAMEDTTVWFETRAMTGGSRNILDLSSESRVEHDSRKQGSEGEPTYGSVEFFGVNPREISLRKTITINFDGVDYNGNDILYPSGNRANGTWRLQIKGETSSGDKITQALRDKGGDSYLVKKILTFTKVGDTGDYYSMSVFPARDLPDFREASNIIAYNGRNTRSKQWGLLRTD